MNDLKDDELRARFAQLRDADELGAPDFQGVLGRARLRPPRGRLTWRPPSRFALSAALAAAILFAIGVARVSRRSEFVPPPLSTWVSPTASLLRTPGSELMRAPRLMSSVLDPATESVTHTGKKK